MRVFCKKLLICLLVFVLLFNFMFQPQAQALTVATAVNGLLEAIGTAADGIAGFMTWGLRVCIMIAEAAILGLMSSIAVTFGYVNEYGDIRSADGERVEHEIGLFTPDDIFFNKLLLTDANVFKIDEDMPAAIRDMRSSIALWYLIMRVIAISILLGILIFIAIRMAIAVVASEKAKYKEMLVNWTISIGLVFVLHYVIIGGCALNSTLVGILSKIYQGSDFESAVGDLLANTMGLSFVGGWTALIVVFMITGQTFAFLVYYIKRMLIISFLTIISPLITITYSIDKLGDGKAQALNTWMKEFFFTVIIQPFHCIIYMVFMSMALAAFNPIESDSTGNVFATIGNTLDSIFGSGLGIDKLVGCILAIVCIKFVWDAEKIIKNIFGIKVSESLGDAVASAAVAGAVVSKTMGMAKGAAGASNNLKRLAVRTGLAERIRGSSYSNRSKEKIAKWEAKEKAAKESGDSAEAAKYASKISKRKHKVARMENGQGIRGKTYKAGQFAGKKISGVTGAIRPKVEMAQKAIGDFMGPEGVQRFKRHVSNAAGVAAALMGASMTYGTSDKTSLVEAGIAGYGAYTGVNNAVLNLMNRKNEDYLDGVIKHDKSLCDVKNLDPEQRTKSDIATDAMYATVMQNNGDFKNLSDDRKKAMADLIKALIDKDINAGLSNEDILAKSDYYNNIADKAMKSLDNGIYNNDLNCDNIALEAKLDPSVFRSVIGDYAEKRICKNMATDNANYDTLAGMEGYHAATLQEFAGKEIEVTESETTEIHQPQSISASDLASELAKYMVNTGGKGTDENLNKLIGLLGNNPGSYTKAINDLNNTSYAPIHLDNINKDIDIVDVIKEIDETTTVSENVQKIVKNIKIDNNITERNDLLKLEQQVKRTVRGVKFQEIMQELNKSIDDN